MGDLYQYLLPDRLLLFVSHLATRDELGLGMVSWDLTSGTRPVAVTRDSSQRLIGSGMLLRLFVSIWQNISCNTKIILAGLILTNSAPSASFPRGAVGKAVS